MRWSHAVGRQNGSPRPARVGRSRGRPVLFPQQPKRGVWPSCGSGTRYRPPGPCKVNLLLPTRNQLEGFLVRREEGFGANRAIVGRARGTGHWLPAKQPFRPPQPATWPGSEQRRARARRYGTYRYLTRWREYDSSSIHHCWHLPTSSIIWCFLPALVRAGKTGRCLLQSTRSERTMVRGIQCMRLIRLILVGLLIVGMPATTVWGLGENSELEIGSHGSQAGQFDELRDLTFDLHGNLYTLEGLRWDSSARQWRGNGRVQKFDPSSGKPLLGFPVRDETFGQNEGPQRIACDAAGRLYVTQPGAGVVQQFAPDGTLLRKIALPRANAICRSASPARNGLSWCAAIARSCRVRAGPGWLGNRSTPLTRAPATFWSRSSCPASWKRSPTRPRTRPATSTSWPPSHGLQGQPQGRTVEGHRRRHQHPQR